MESRMEAPRHADIHRVQVGPAQPLAPVAVGPEASNPKVRDVTSNNVGRLASEAISPVAR